MVGLPNTRVIPAGWSQHHRPTANSTMTVPCVINRISDGPPPFPMPDGWSNEAPIHTTMCRVQELNNEGGGTPGEQPTTERRYLVPLPLKNQNGVPLPDLRAGERGDVIHVIGRQLRIIQIMFGSLEWERDVICMDNQTQQNPD